MIHMPQVRVIFKIMLQHFSPVIHQRMRTFDKDYKSKPLVLVLDFKMSFLYYCSWYLSLWPQSAACRVAHLAQFFRASRSENEPKLKLGSPLLLPQIRVIHKMCCYQQTNFVSFKAEKLFCLIKLEQHGQGKKSSQICLASQWLVMLSFQ